MNNKYAILFAILFVFVENLISQPQIIGNVNFPPDPYNEDVLDKSLQNIYYNLTFEVHSDQTGDSRLALTVLQIGVNHLKFVDFHTIKLDSLRKAHSHLKTLGTNELNENLALRQKVVFKYEIFKSFKNINYTVLSSYVPKHKYEFTIESFTNWKLESEYKTILDYKVQKATVFYSGRKWVAWFAEDIPISLGPYVFGGLPGLILEMYDDKKDFHFIVSGMDSKPMEMYRRVDEKIIKTNKKEYFKTEKNFHERPDLYFDTSNIRGDISKSKKMPYNPIEIID